MRKEYGAILDSSMNGKDELLQDIRYVGGNEKRIELRSGHAAVSLTKKNVEDILSEISSHEVFEGQKSCEDCGKKTHVSSACPDRPGRVMDLEELPFEHVQVGKSKPSRKKKKKIRLELMRMWIDVYKNAVANVGLTSEAVSTANRAITEMRKFFSKSEERIEGDIRIIDHKDHTRIKKMNKAAKRKNNEPSLREDLGRRELEGL